MKDKLAQLSNAQALTATAKSTYSYDLGLARKVGPGRTLFAVFHVTTTFAGGTSTVFQVGTATSADLATAFKVGTQSPVILQAALVEGAIFVVPFWDNPTAQRYLGVNYDDPDTGVYSAGAVDCFIQENPPTNMGD